MSKHSSKMFANDYLVLEGEGSFGGPITVKTGNKKTRKETIEKIRSDLREWSEKFPYLKNEDTKIDLAIVVYRYPSYMRRQDVDNVAKLVLDALKGCLFADDSQIVRLLVYKLDAALIEGYDTESLVISFRKHNPKKEMVLVNKKVLS